jgi:hypothetical protein
MDCDKHVTCRQCNLEVKNHRLLLVSGNIGRVKQKDNKGPNTLEENEKDIVRIARNKTND